MGVTAQDRGLDPAQHPLPRAPNNKNSTGEFSGA
jgi:hypothetical protein